MKKDSFVFHTKWKNQIADLTIEQRGILLTAVLDFHSDTELPEMDPLTNMVFSFMKDQFTLDAEKYFAICEKRSTAGKMGGAPRNNQNAKKQPENDQKQANKQNKQLLECPEALKNKGLEDIEKTTKTSKQAKQAKQADNVNVNENVNDDSVKQNQNYHLHSFTEKPLPAADSGAGKPAVAPRGYTFTACCGIAKRGKVAISQDGIREFCRVNDAHGWTLNGEPLNVLRALRGFLKYHPEYKAEPGGTDPEPEATEQTADPERIRKQSKDPETAFFDLLVERIPDTNSGREIKRRLLADDLDNEQLQQLIYPCIGSEDATSAAKKYIKSQGFKTLLHSVPRVWGRESMRAAFPDIDFAEG